MISLNSLKEFICKVFNFKNTGPTSSAASSEIGSFLLQFHDPRLDYNYIHQADYMLKYSVLLAWCCEMSLIYVQLMDSLHMNSISFSVVVILIFTSSALLIITWCKKICYWRYSSLSHTYSAVTYFLFKLADGIQHSLIQRIVIYVYFIVSYFCIIAIILVCS